MIAPVLDELATEQAGKALVDKVNMDDAPELAARFGIKSVRRSSCSRTAGP